MDRSASAGIIGAAFAIGRSFQPNLLTRGTTDQAIITGTASGVAYEVFSAGDSFLTAIASRIGRTQEPSAVSRLIVAGAAGTLGAGVALALRWKEHESDQRALLRLGGMTLAAVSSASILGTSTSRRPDGGPGLPQVIAATGVGIASWLTTKPWKSLPGSATYGQTAASTEFRGKYFFEDQVREVTPLKALAVGAGVSALTLWISFAESALTNAMAKGAAVALGGQPQDHRLAGRVASLSIFTIAGWVVIGQVDAMLSKGGGGVEPALKEPPSIPEVTGSAASGLAWNKQTREGARWLSMALPPETINSVMQITTAKQPIRVYSSVDIAPTAEERARVLLAEIDRTQALSRKAFALFGPTGSGYVNYVANETFEYLTEGDCASAAIQYSVLPSALSLTKVDEGTLQTRMVLQGIIDRLLAMPKSKRPKFYLFGESLGSQVTEEMFRGLGVMGLEGTNLDGALWIGTPAASKWRDELWGQRSIKDPSTFGPGPIFLPRNLHDWYVLPDDEKEKVNFLLLANGDDPIPKFGSQLIWRKPDWLGYQDFRPLGAPHHTQWIPVTTFLMTFLDMMNALVPTPGVFSQGGHDYRAVLPEAVSKTWNLKASEEQMQRVNIALRQRELAWELHRDWTAAEHKPGHEIDAARAKVLENATRYVGHPVDENELHEIVRLGLNPILE